MRFIINGGKALSGDIKLKGFKNSATPIIAATILSDKPCLLKNIPRIGDVLKILEIMKVAGSKQKWVSGDKIEIDNSNFNPDNLDQNLMSEIRSSILLIGPILARFGRVSFVTPGGCKIGSRPIDTHLDALGDLGVRIIFNEDSGVYSADSRNVKTGAEIILKELSVTATENLLMLGAAHSFVVRLAAVEPHVEDLIKFLKKLGVAIENRGSHSFGVGPGKRREDSVEHEIINDPIEAGTLAILGGATKSDINIIGVEKDYLDAPLRKLQEFGVPFSVAEGVLKIEGTKTVLKAAQVKTMPYPGLPTDLQAPFGVLATQAEGASLIFDTMYENRLKYINELKKMGADATILDPHRAVINGPTVLYGAEIESLDLRAGATLVIAALVAEGQSILGGVEQIDRGYENLDGRLRELGADITRA
jgi:UDP-N-acetylglucosamine 1-carboxyvinyltransferase